MDPHLGHLRCWILPFWGAPPSYPHIPAPCCGFCLQACSPPSGLLSALGPALHPQSLHGGYRTAPSPASVSKALPSLVCPPRVLTPSEAPSSSPCMCCSPCLECPPSALPVGGHGHAQHPAQLPLGSFPYPGRPAGPQAPQGPASVLFRVFSLRPSPRKRDLRPGTTAPQRTL